MSEASGLPGVTLDDKDEAALQATFGTEVVANAEELVRQNQARFSREQLQAQKQRVNPGLTATLFVGDREVALDGNGQVIEPVDAEPGEYKPEVEDAIGHPIEKAVVRGRGRSAVISYVYEGPRGGYEKDIIPYAQVFGSKSERAERVTPSQAAESVLSDAEHEAEQAFADARAEAKKIAEEARDAASKVIREAEEEAQRIREDAALGAVEAASEAEEAQDADAPDGKASKPAKGRGKASKPAGK